MSASDICIGNVVRDPSGTEYRVVGIDYTGPPRIGPIIILDPLVKTARGIQYKHVKLSEVRNYEVVG